MTAHVRRWWPVASILTIALTLAACGGGAPAGSEAGDASNGESVSETSQSSGDPGSAAGLCDVIGSDLAEAALGQAAGAPQFGDVVPRPNGIYCRYSAAADANVNVEAQLKEMTRAEFDELAGLLGMTESLSGVGDAAYLLERSTMGGAGASVAAFDGTRGVTVILNGEGDSAALIAATTAIAEAALASPR